MKRLLIFLLSLCGGIYSAHKLSLTGTCLMFILICLLEILITTFEEDKFKNSKSVWSFLKKKYFLIELLIVAFFFGFGFLRMKQIDNHTNKKAEEVLYTSKNFDGVITKADERISNFKVVIKLKGINEKVEMYLSKDNYTEIYPGDEVKLKGVLTPLKENSNLGMYNDKQNKNEDGIFYEFQGSLVDYCPKNNYILSFFTRLRRLICKMFDKTMNEKTSSFLKAMIVGETQFLGSDFKELFKEGGVAHILAISGLHISLIAAIVNKVLSMLKFSYKTKTLLSISIVLFYGVLTGLSVSTVRAMLMILFNEITNLLGRDYLRGSGPFMAAFLMLVYKPIWLFSLGFILSFSSVLAIRYKLPFKKFKNESLNLSIFLFNMAILAYNFYTLSGLSIVANILIVPLAEMLVSLSFAIMLSYFVNVNVSIICGKLAETIVRYFENVLTMLSGISGFNIVTGKIPFISVVLMFILYAVLFNYLKRNIQDNKVKRKWILLMITLLIVTAVTILPKGNRYHVTFLDVEHGDSSVLFNDKKNECVVIDGGGKGNSEKDVGTYNVYPYIKYLGIRKIDYAVASHTDRDHIKGIIELCNLTDVSNVIVPDVNNEGDLYERLIKICKAKNINIYKMKNGDELNLGAMHFKCIYPFDDTYKLNLGTNNSSLVLICEIYGKKILYAGDIEEEAESMILEKGEDIDCDILKVAHHGSKTSSTGSFIEKVNPSYAIVSGNYSNIKTFNSVQKWKFKNSHVLSTYYNGMIEFTIKED